MCKGVGYQTEESGEHSASRTVISTLLDAPKGTVRYESDCGDYAMITRLEDKLQFSFAWLNYSGDGDIKGFRQDITIPLSKFRLVLDWSESVKYLYIPMSSKALIDARPAAKTISKIMKDKRIRQAFSKAMRDCFRWPGDTVTLYPDGGYNFFFTTASGFPKNGGLILHESERDGYPYTINDIARYLTSQSIPTPRGKTVWSVSTIRSILSNEKYAGNALLQKTYTVDYLTKEVRKNCGELPQYLIEYSHDPIIDPETFNQVQAKIEAQTPYRRKIRGNSPLSNTIVCGVCGGFYGHKVWHNHENTDRYDVWYCNAKYGSSDKCPSPVLREDEIKSAIEVVLRKLGKERTKYTDALWRKTVEVVTVYPGGKLEFRLKSGETASYQL